MVWCHDVCGVYMEQSGNPQLMGDLLAQHGNGETLGATGMSNPMKTFAGIETFLLHAQKVQGGWRVNGNLPWVSNLGPDHYFGAVADVVDEAHHTIPVHGESSTHGLCLVEQPGPNDGSGGVGDGDPIKALIAVPQRRPSFTVGFMEGTD